MQIHIYFYCPWHNCPIGHAKWGAISGQSRVHWVARAMNASIHLFHPTPLHIKVLNPCFQITILKNRLAVSLNHVKALQMTLSCGLNPLDTNQEHNEQTSHDNVHVQSFLQGQLNVISIYVYLDHFGWIHVVNYIME